MVGNGTPSACVYDLQLWTLQNRCVVVCKWFSAEAKYF